MYNNNVYIRITDFPFNIFFLRRWYLYEFMKSYSSTFPKVISIVSSLK